MFTGTVERNKSMLKVLLAAAGTVFALGLGSLLMETLPVWFEGLMFVTFFSFVLVGVAKFFR